MTVKQTISEWLDESQSLMVDRYNALGFRASGNWEKSLSTEVTESAGKYHGKLEGANYTYWLEHGRKAGKYPPIKAIRQWIDDKGIIPDGISKNSLAFLIARKIATEGTKARPGLVSDVLTKNRIDQLFKDIGMSFINQVRSDVLKTFK